MIDTRYVYGANCTWHGPISAIGKRGGIPCCPSCGSMLFEFPHKDDWTRAADRYEAAGHPGYRNMIDWSERRCFPTRKALEDAYAAAAKIGDSNGPTA